MRALAALGTGCMELLPLFVQETIGALATQTLCHPTSHDQARAVINERFTRMSAAPGPLTIN